MAVALYTAFRVLDMAPRADSEADDQRRHCCDRMREAVTHRCAQHPDPYDCPDNLVHYAPVFDEYGLIVHDGGASYVMIRFCPWCGTGLPESKRDLWFDRLEALGHARPLGDATIPEAFKSDAWWQADANS